MGKENLIFSLCVWHMSFSVKSIGFGTEESNDELVVLDELLEAITVNSG